MHVHVNFNWCVGVCAYYVVGMFLAGQATLSMPASLASSLKSLIILLLRNIHKTNLRSTDLRVCNKGHNYYYVGL